ncbi:MAG: leucine-rich repeat domain-containing protein [Clostridia bacterium]|nr:leucine-rich repeat domain-containing protein [Clostridia bacterium]
MKNGRIERRDTDITWQIEDGTLTFTGHGRVAGGGFSDETDVTRVVLGEGVEAGYMAFWKMSSLREVVFAADTKEIGELAFAWSGLREITIPPGVTELAAETFRYSRLERVTLHGGLKKIGDKVFEGCTSLREIELPEGLERIGYGAFRKTGLTAVNLPSTLRYLDNAAFTDLASLTIGANTTYSVIDGMLCNASGSELYDAQLVQRREEYVVPDSVIKIGSYAFSSMGNIRVRMHEGVRWLENYAFAECNLGDIVFSPALTRLSQGSFFRCWGREKLELRSPTVMVLMKEACREFRDLREVVLVSDEAVCIDEEAFAACPDLMRVELRAPTVRIELRAFGECPKLERVDIEADKLEIGKYAFVKCPSLRQARIVSETQTVAASAFAKKVQIENP